MLAEFIQYIFLILIILGLVMLANRLKIAYPIVLVIGGLLISFAARFSQITISPELIFFVFLPPLLYEAAWQVSWKDFWKFRRIITSFAFPIVIITSCVVAFASNAIIPGFTLALGFLLGGIVSPPDAVSATTILRQVKAPRTLVSILEGESLLNDASSLIVFRFAIAAVITSQFHLGEAVMDFFLVIIAGAGIGLLIGFAFYAVHRYLPTTPAIDIVLTLVAPYCMYYASEQFHFSGVIAVVSGGLYLSAKRHLMLSYQSRMQGTNVWTSFVFVLNGLIFFLIGLQLPSITHQLGDISLSTAIWYGLAITLVLIIARFACMYGAVVFTRFMSRFITVADATPSYKAPLIGGWAGMRGVVSLAMALSIPVMVDGVEFPHRNLILFITFIVILVTLVLQGLTLPWLIRKVKLEDRFTPISEEEQELLIQKKMAKASLQYLQDTHGHLRQQNQHLDNLFSRLELDLIAFEQDSAELSEYGKGPLREFRYINLLLLDFQRNLLHKMNQKTEFDEELIRKYLGLLDNAEHKLREKTGEMHV